MGFKERFTEHLNDMGPDGKGLRRQSLAEALGVSAASITLYGKGESRPTLEDLPRVATVMGLDLNWLLGAQTTTKWSPEIQQLRLWLRTKLAEIQAPNRDWVDRVIQIIRLLQEQSETCRQVWFMAGILKLSEADFTRVMTERAEVSPLALSRLAEFCNLPDEWILDPELAPLGDPPDLGDYQNIVLRCVEDGITPTQLQANYDWIKKRIEMHAKLG